MDAPKQMQFSLDVAVVKYAKKCTNAHNYRAERHKNKAEAVVKNQILLTLPIAYIQLGNSVLINAISTQTGLEIQKNIFFSLVMQLRKT